MLSSAMTAPLHQAAHVAPGHLRLTEEEVLAAVPWDGHALQQADKELVLAAVRGDPRMFLHVNGYVQEDLEVCFEAVRACYQAQDLQGIRDEHAGRGRYPGYSHHGGYSVMGPEAITQAKGWARRIFRNAPVLARAALHRIEESPSGLEGAFGNRLAFPGTPDAPICMLLESFSLFRKKKTPSCIVRCVMAWEGAPPSGFGSGRPPLWRS